MSTTRTFPEDGAYVRLTYLDERTDAPSQHGHGRYRCFVRLRGHQGIRVWVEPPAILEWAVDSTRGFTDAARAAVAIAAVELDYFLPSEAECS